MKYFLGFLASIALVVAVFFLVLRGLTGGGDKPTTSIDRKLTSYATTSTTMRLTIDGPINADIIHNGYVITIGRDASVIETYQGYDQRQTLASQTYANTEEGYRQFLAALDLAGYTRGNTEGKARTPEGVCATDLRVQVEIITGATVAQSYWTTTCDEKGTFRGNITEVARLFRAQTPDYAKMTRSLKL